MADYENASFETPYVDNLEIEFIYVDRREYSRASAAATIVTESGINKKLVIGSSFIFPGWEGQLRAYDVSGVAFVAGPSSELQTITTSNLNDATGRDLIAGATIYWDAGTLLNDRDPGSRTVYTALRAGGNVANPLVRTNFVRTNVGNPSTAGSLAWCLNDVNNDNAGLVDFVRGTNRYWKLGDINHSTPVVVGPPAEDSTYMGTGYAEFKTAYATRPKVIYVGANDGMLHCFDTATGEELWGFIPYNLLPKLRNMYAVDAANHSRFYAHDVYCDGSPTVADVQIGGTWKTVLVTGQGPGSGSILGAGNVAGAINYYWALDVTDPTNPQPLWELTHTTGRDNRTDPTMGETWSTPAIGKVNHSGTARWVAFMGSGYDNVTIRSYNLGRRFYVVRLDTGVVITSTTEVSQVNTATMSGARTAYRYADIVATIPGSPTAIDLDGNGFTNSVFVGDLDGRLYRMNVAGSNPNSWTLTAIYTDNLYYPIITKPAAWVDPLEGGPARARVYFGTGGRRRRPGRPGLFVRRHHRQRRQRGDRRMVPRRPRPARPTTSPINGAIWGPAARSGPTRSSPTRSSISAPCGAASRPSIPASTSATPAASTPGIVRYTSAIPVGGTAFKTTAATPPEYLELHQQGPPRRDRRRGRAGRPAASTSARSTSRNTTPRWRSWSSPSGRSCGSSPGGRSTGSSGRSASPPARRV